MTNHNKQSENDMFKTKTLSVAFALFATTAMADVPIYGTVQSKCSVHTETQGIYGNPTADKLSTAAVDGGVDPKIRYDVSLADSYIARISYPTSFSSSPSLNDVVNWSGAVAVAEVTDPLMSAYETNKVEYNNTTEYDMTIAGSTWFKIESTAEYGYNQALPGGNYTAIVMAECIAK